MISSSLMVVNWNKELLSKCSFLCTNKAKKSCRLLYIKNASALSQTKAGAFSFWVSVMLFKTIQREERFVPWGTARRYRQSWRYLIRLLSAGILKRGCTRARKEYSAVLVKPVRCIVLYWIGLRPRFAASFGGSPRVAASCREKAFSQETGQICGFLPKPHARGKQSFLFCPSALIWCISHTHGGRLAEMTPQNRDSCSTTHKGGIFPKWEYGQNRFNTPRHTGARQGYWPFLSNRWTGSRGSNSKTQGHFVPECSPHTRGEIGGSKMSGQ